MIATHRCKVCGALWRFDPPSWELLSVARGECCEEDIPQHHIEVLGVLGLRASGPGLGLGEAFREALKDAHAHPRSACARLGIPFRTHKHWMAQEPDEGSELEAYQRQVELALVDQEAASHVAMEQAVKDAKGSHATPMLNMLKWRHEQRFRGLHDEPVQKIEVTNTAASLSDAQISARLAELDAKERGE